MKKSILVVAVCAGFASAATTTNAQVLDLNTVKCSEWLQSGADNIGYTMAWLDGYYQDEDADPVIDFAKMKEKGGKLAAYCATNPTIGLGTAGERLFGKK